MRCATWIGHKRLPNGGADIDSDPRCPNEAVTRELIDVDGTGRTVTIGHCQFHADYWARVSASSTPEPDDA